MDKILAAAKIIATARRTRAPLAALAPDIAPRDEAEGYQIQRVIDACARSNASGRWVAVD